MADVLKSPFPYFGGKSRVADLVWSRLGNVDNFVEPFAGSLAVLLRRGKTGRIETVNDVNHYIVNFWRAVKSDPEAVAEFADHPVCEADLHARHRYLVLGDRVGKFRTMIETDPDYFDPKFAGWWVWGQCCWIGGGWCDETGRRNDGSSQQRRPLLGQMRHGITSLGEQLPDLSGDGGAFGRGVVASGQRKRPRLAQWNQRGTGVVGEPSAKLPLLNSHDGNGTGVHALPSKRPMTVLGNSSYLPGVHGEIPETERSGACADRRAWLIDWMLRLQDRLRLVRVCHGHWSRVCDSNTTMVRLGMTGVFLDPPYARDLVRLRQWIDHLLGNGEKPAIGSGGTSRSGGLYSTDSMQDVDHLVADVHVWCRRWGEIPGVRIALCGYAGEHEDLEQLGWSCEMWKAHGGYANRNKSNANKHRERIWFSPEVQVSADRTLF